MGSGLGLGGAWVGDVGRSLPTQAEDEAQAMWASLRAMESEAAAEARVAAAATAAAAKVEREVQLPTVRGRARVRVKVRVDGCGLWAEG